MTEFGGPEVLKPAELPPPQAGPGEALIRVTRAGVNFADTHTRTNSYVRKATLPLVPGGTPSTP
jgi:NADPH:quinone reductase